MKNVLSDVATFHRVFGAPTATEIGFPAPERIALRKSLIAEEMSEFTRGVSARDMVAVADGLADLIYVLVGTALEFGIPLDAVWNEVQRANMSKLNKPSHAEGCTLSPTTECSCGAVLYREDGKVLKGPDYRPPDVLAVLRAKGFVPRAERRIEKPCDHTATVQEE